MPAKAGVEKVATVDNIALLALKNRWRCTDQVSNGYVLLVFALLYPSESSSVLISRSQRIEIRLMAYKVKQISNLHSFSADPRRRLQGTHMLASGYRGFDKLSR